MNMWASKSFVLLLVVANFLDISGQIVLKAFENERIVFFGDSIPFSGTLTDRGFISLLQQSMHNYDHTTAPSNDSLFAANKMIAGHSTTKEPSSAVSVHHSVENIGQRHFDLNDFANNKIPDLLGHYEPSIAIFMLVDDMMLQMLNSWLLEDNRKKKRPS